MSKPQVEVIITPTGQVTIDAVGFKGGACKEATAALEKALGTVTGTKRKPEMDERTAHGTQQKAGR